MTGSNVFLLLLLGSFCSLIFVTIYVGSPLWHLHFVYNPETTARELTPKKRSEYTLSNLFSLPFYIWSFPAYVLFLGGMAVVRFLTTTPLFPSKS
jgi:hypothetical protein